MNQNPEQLARHRIDQQLIACGWTIPNKSSINLRAGMGVAIREYQTKVGPANYILFLGKKPVGIIEAKIAEESIHVTVQKEQSEVTPNNRDFCFFYKNIVSDYGFEKAITDGELKEKVYY